MKERKRWFTPASALAGLCMVVLASGALLGFPSQDEPFPHAVHENLFPVCQGCHLGVVTGASEDLFPQPASCLQCHDGERQVQVEWSGRSQTRASNLQFTHPEHARLMEAAGEEVSCQSCHAAGDDPSRTVPQSGPLPRMDVALASPESCLQCHVHSAPEHLAPMAACQVCHVPLAEAPQLPTSRLAAFPWPESHDEPGFLEDHGPTNRLQQFSCSVCHARETCQRCHVNAGEVDAIIALAPDPRVATLEEGRMPEYPVPASHLAAGWGWEHGESALGAPAQCSTCHAQTSCLECHGGGDASPTVIAALPTPVPGGAQGVDLSGAAAAIHPADFDQRHGIFAATGMLQCTQCHSQSYCADCHDGSDSQRFHPSNFMERHAVDVFAGGGECQACHSTEAFCRDCHVATGVASNGGRDVAFHTAQPLWILSHGQAARIGLESCASCHRQTDCLACHSSVLGRGVNPHGAGFDAGAMAARNRVTCQWCHLGDPLGGS